MNPELIQSLLPFVMAQLNRPQEDAVRRRTVPVPPPNRSMRQLPMPPQGGESGLPGYDQRFTDLSKQMEAEAEKRGETFGGDADMEAVVQELLKQDLMRPQMPNELHSSGSGAVPGTEWADNPEARGLAPLLRGQPMEQFDPTQDLMYVPGEGWCYPDGTPVPEEDIPTS